MKKILLLLTLISFGCIAQNNPALFRNGVETKLIGLDTLTTAQRDAITLKASKGYIIFNADTNVLNLYNGTSWGEIGATPAINAANVIVTPSIGGDSDAQAVMTSLFNNKASLNSPTFTGTPVLPSTFTIGANSFIRSGAHNLTLTTSGTTNVTFPSGTSTLLSSQAVATITALKTFNASTLRLNNPANNFYYNVLGSAIVANRNVTLPLLTSNDEFTFNDAVQTFQNKTFNLTNNTFSATKAQMDAALSDGDFLYVGDTPDTAFRTITYSGTTSEAYLSSDPNIVITLSGNLDLTISGTVSGDSGILQLKSTSTHSITLNGANDLTTTGNGGTMYFAYMHDADGLEWYRIYKSLPETIQIACSDLTTDLTTGTTKAYFRMPYAATLTGVRVSLLTAGTTTGLTVDINENGTTVLSTKLTTDATEKTSTTATTAFVISDSALAYDSEITIDFDAVPTGGKGVILAMDLIRL